MNNFYATSKKAVACFTRSTPVPAVFLRAALIFSLYLCGNGYVAAQHNCSGFSGTMITNFADWDWTIPTNHPNYCATWATILTSNPGTKFVVGAPCFGFQNGAVDKINLAQDYTKAKGWELLRMNMGGRQPVTTAHFILYNKYSGIIRTFFYIDRVAPFTNGMTITMSHTSSNGNRNSGVLALSQPLVQSQDYYLQNQSLNDEVISYVPVLTAREGWVYADFQTGFDSYTGNARYTSTSLQFAVSATTFSNVLLDGKFNFQTTEDIQGGGYAVGGKATNAGLSGLNNFLTKGQKVLKSFNYEDLTKFKKSFTDKASKTAAMVPVPIVQTQQGALASAVASSSSSGGLLKKISGIAGSLGSAFGLISTVIGVLWPEESAGTAPATFIPTVSTGTLSLQGTISTAAPYTSITMQIPGGQHFFPGSNGQTDGGNQPYYDCPLGIFNLKNTPQLAKHTYLNSFFTTYDSYEVSNALIAVYNDAAGLKLRSVQAAIVAETPTAVFQRPYYHSPFYSTANIQMQQVATGEIEVISANDSLVTYATPFIDLGRFRNIALTAAGGSKVYVRIKAELQRKDVSVDAPPIFYVQDYAIQANVTAMASNPRSSLQQSHIPNVSFSLNDEPPFSNLASALMEPNIFPATSSAYDPSSPFW